MTMRADSGFYNHAVAAACRALDVRFSSTIRQQPNVQTLIEAIPEADWTQPGTPARSGALMSAQLRELSPTRSHTVRFAA